MREHFDDVLEAEQAAALEARNRQRTLRDRFLEAESRQETALIHGADGHIYRGNVAAVGSDHILLQDSERQLFVSIDHVLGVEFH